VRQDEDQPEHDAVADRRSEPRLGIAPYPERQHRACCGQKHGERPHDLVDHHAEGRGVEVGAHAQERSPHEPYHLQHDRGRNREHEDAIKASAGSRRKSREEGKRQEVDEQRELELERLGPDIDAVDEPLVHLGGEAGRDHEKQHGDAEARIERFGAEQIGSMRPRRPEGTAE
jgi:hypothetical protein